MRDYNMNQNKTTRSIIYNNLYKNSKSKKKQQHYHPNHCTNYYCLNYQCDKKQNSFSKCYHHNQHVQIQQFQLSKSNQSSLNTSENKQCFKKNGEDTNTNNKKQSSEKSHGKSKFLPKQSKMLVHSFKIKEEQSLKPEYLPYKNVLGLKNNKLNAFGQEVIKSNNKRVNKFNQSISENGKQTKDTQFQSDQILGQDIHVSTIIVKQQQLKRFTQKFARQKIQFQQKIEIYAKQLNQLKSINVGLNNQKNNYLNKIQFQQLSILDMKQEISTLRQKLRISQLNKKQNICQFEQIFQKKAQHIKNLQQIISQKQQKIQQIVSQLQKRERQLQKSQYENIQNKTIFPLGNINHVSSIHSQVYSQSSPQQMIIQQVTSLRQQCINYQTQQIQINKSLVYFKIQNQHLMRELDLEKQTSAQLRDQISQLKNLVCGNSPQWERKQRTCGNVQEFSGSCSVDKQHDELANNQMKDLISENNMLTQNNRTLLKSLKVSSEMIHHLKQQASQFKNKYHNEVLRRSAQQCQKDGPKITVDHIKMVVRSMMKQQLQLQQKLKKAAQQQATKPANPADGKRKKKHYYKTQKDSQKDESSNYKQSFMQEYFLEQKNEVCSLNSYHNFMENKFNYLTSRTLI